MEISKESAKATFNSATTKAKELADKIPDNPVTRTIGSVAKQGWQYAKNNKADALMFGASAIVAHEVMGIDGAITDGTAQIVDALQASDL